MRATLPQKPSITNRWRVRSHSFWTCRAKPAEGLAVTSLSGTQIQRKLGPYIDTFLTSKLLGELDGNMGDSRANARVGQVLEKCVANIERNQLKDGSWNISGGWAPIVGTSVASQSLFIAQQKGVAVQPMAMARIEQYTKLTAAPRMLPVWVLGLEEA